MQQRVSLRVAVTFKLKRFITTVHAVVGDRIAS